MRSLSLNSTLAAHATSHRPSTGVPRPSSEPTPHAPTFRVSSFTPPSHPAAANASAGAPTSGQNSSPTSSPTSSPASSPASAAAALNPSLASQLAPHVASANAQHLALRDSVERLEAGEALDQRELLVLQAQCYRYAHQADVATRVADRAASCVKQLLQTQL